MLDEKPTGTKRPVTEVWMLHAQTSYEHEVVVGRWEFLAPLFAEQAKRFGVFAMFDPDPKFPYHVAQGGSSKVELLVANRILMKPMTAAPAKKRKRV